MKLKERIKKFDFLPGSTGGDPSSSWCCRYPLNLSRNENELQRSSEEENQEARGHDGEPWPENKQYD